MGFAVSRQIRGAVARNRARRRLREAYRQIRPHMPVDVAVILIARPGAATRAFPDLVEDLRRLAEALTLPARRSPARA